MKYGRMQMQLKRELGKISYIFVLLVHGGWLSAALVRRLLADIRFIRWQEIRDLHLLLLRQGLFHFSLF